jgi:polysaccharide biosynthesis/export protein
MNCKSIQRLLANFVLIFLSACSASENRIPPQDLPSFQAAQQSSTSEINQRLATLALSVGQGVQNYQIGPEDLLQITLYNIAESEARVTPRTVSVRVSQQGVISVPLLGEIKVSGLTVSGLEKDLVKRYEKYIYGPQVGVLITEYRQRASVIGAVQKPGVFELSGPKTVLDLVALAGGITDKAGTQLHLYRQGPNGRESYVIDLAGLANSSRSLDPKDVELISMPVQASDVINIPAAGNFFVDGAVRKPGPYPLGQRVTLTQALSTAGGVDTELNSSDIQIFRRKGASGMEPVSIDYNAVIAGSATDPQILADDVIIVPTSSAKWLVKRFVGALVSGISVGSFIR